MNRRAFIAGGIAMTAVPSLAWASASTIQTLLMFTKDILIKLRDNDYDYDEIKADLDLIFDRNRIARVIAGRGAWLDASKDEQAAFTDAITEYLFTTYIGGLKNYGIDNAIKLIDTLKFRESKRGNWVFYKTVLFLNPEVGIEIRTINERVVDVSVENISLVITIRDEFANTIRRDGLAGVTERLNNV